MKRRDLVTGLALAGMKLEAQQDAPESLYIPQAHLVKDRRFLHDFVDESSFVGLVTVTPGKFASHTSRF